MPIQVSCSCGKVFRVRNDRAGQKGKCPECGQRVVVPFPVLDADDEAPPVPWNTFSEEWTGDGAPTAEASRGIDLGIDLTTVPISPPVRPTVELEPESEFDDSPAVEPEPVEADLPYRADPPAVGPGPVYRPADPPAPSAAATPAVAGVQRVVVVGIRVPFEDLFDLLLKATIATLCVSFVVGLVAILVAGFFWTIWSGSR